jgi:hypothetical protein
MYLSRWRFELGVFESPATRASLFQSPAPALAPFPVPGRSALFLLLGGVAGAAAGLRRMQRSRWRPAIGGRPHRRPPRRRVSPAPFFFADCGWLLVGRVFYRT